MSETDKYRHITAPFCQGNGLDIGSGGDPVVPWAIQADLPSEKFAAYNQAKRPASIHLTCPVEVLPFKDASLDFVYSSHLLEDFEFGRWPWILREWARVVRTGGHLVVVIPDAELWKAALDRGQPPNCAHKHEGNEGEIGTILEGICETVRDWRSALTPEDYSIIYVGRKL